MQGFGIFEVARSSQILGSQVVLSVWFFAALKSYVNTGGQYSPQPPSPIPEFDSGPLPRPKNCPPLKNFGFFFLEIWGLKTQF